MRFRKCFNSFWCLKLEFLKVSFAQRDCSLLQKFTTRNNSSSFSIQNLALPQQISGSKDPCQGRDKVDCSKHPRSVRTPDIHEGNTRRRIHNLKKHVLFSIKMTSSAQKEIFYSEQSPNRRIFNELKKIVLSSIL